MWKFAFKISSDILKVLSLETILLQNKVKKYSMLITDIKAGLPENYIETLHEIMQSWSKAKQFSRHREEQRVQQNCS